MRPRIDSCLVEPRGERPWRSGDRVGFATFVCGLLLLVAVPFTAGQSPGMSRLQNDDPNNCTYTIEATTRSASA